jgi:hypothetical protein
MPISTAQAQYRTVSSIEQGSIFQNPNGQPWTEYGYFDGSPQSLSHDAIRVLMSNFIQFYPAQDQMAHSFPYSKLRTYESAQIAGGKAPIFVTATYAGKKRPVLFSWSLKLVNNKPTAPSNQWQYVVNVQDQRFIHFWINQYVQPILTQYQASENFGPNLWLHLDQGAFEYSLYGVLDDNNNFVPGVTWDSAFPQSQAAFETAIETFFSQVKALAPNVNMIVNIGGQANPSHFPQLFANVTGGMTESMYGWWRPNPSAYSRNLWYTQGYQYFTWLASRNSVTALRSVIPSSDPSGVLLSFVIYSLLEGPNSFFAPGDTNSNSTDPSQWAGMKAQLGNPLSPVQASAATSEGAGYRLFSRSFQGGIAYLNGTGTTQTIQLNPSVTHYDAEGSQITSHSIVIGDADATFVTTAPTALPAPQISPRYGAPVMSPLSVTIKTNTSGATIRYTLDGSNPTTSSPAYTGPISLTHSTVVTARAFYGSKSSFASAASYTVSTSALTAQFVLSSDSGMSGTYYPVVSLSAIPTQTVEVFYSVQNGTPTSGSYKFLPGMTYGILPVTTGSTGTITVTLTNVVGGARLGSKDTLIYTNVK